MTTCSNPRSGNDIVRGLGGDDVLIASAGDDILHGGSGNDRVVFRGNISDYVFSQAGEGGPLVFYHNAEYGQKSTGTETVYEVERFVFKDAKVTLRQLLNNVLIAQGPVLDGTPQDDFLYAATNPVTINGRGGDDRITGSDGADILKGNSGNDTFVSGRGADRVSGGSGIDTWLFPRNDELGNPTTKVDLQAGTTWDGDSADTLSGIENATVQDDRDTELFGDGSANVITAAAGRDWIDGRGGNDRIYGNDGQDLLIGGRGADRVSGGGDFGLSRRGRGALRPNQRPLRRRRRF